MRKLLVLIGLMFVMNAAKADIFFEPYFGSVVSGKLSGELYDELHELDEDTETSEKLDGTGYGARLAYQFVNVMFGVDYMASNGKADGMTSTFSSTGAYIGFSIPMIRFWAEYIFSSEINAEGDVDGVDTVMDITGGTGSKIGIGWSPIPYLSINAEVINIKYSKFSFKQDNEQVADDFDLEDKAADLNVTFISLSVPI